MNKKTLSIANLVALTLMLAVNVISTFGLFGVTPVKDVSDKLPNLLVPMGYTFSVIWTLIYIGLIYYTVKELVRKEDKYDNGLFFMLTNLLNILWIVTFTLKMYLLSSIVIVMLLVALYNIVSRITNNNLDKTIFSIYTSWILVASIVNITSFIVSLDLIPFDSLIMKIVSIIMVAVATLFIIMKNNVTMKITYVFALAGIAANHIFNFNYAYIDMMIIVGAVIAYVLYSLIKGLFIESPRKVGTYETV